MAGPEKKRSPLISLEDWWTVWFGLVIILVATVLALGYYSDIMPKLKVPKLGGWVSSPTDVFFGAKKTKLTLKEDVTPLTLAEAINAKDPKAFAEVVPAERGVRLRISSTRDGAGQVIKVSPNLAGGEELAFTTEDPDPGGMGARAYVSRILASESVDLGSGLFTITAQRTVLLIWPWIVTFLLVGILTAIGVAVMSSSQLSPSVKWKG